MALPIQLTPTTFMKPARLSQPTAWVEHIPFAFWLLETHAPRVYVELGTHTGNSYLAVCQAVAHLRTQTRCFAIDTWRGDEHAGFYGDEVFQTLSGYHDQRYADFSKLVRSTFDDALGSFADGSIDLLHIDGLHSYDAVKHDFDTWVSKVSERGVVLLHDTNVHEHNFGVFRLWAELRERYPSFEFLHGHGLGVLGVGADLPAELRRLFDASAVASAEAAVRDTFAQLGAAVQLQATLELEQQAKAALRDELGELAKHYNSMSARAAGLATELEATSAAFANERIQHQAQVEELRARLTASDERVERLRRLLGKSTVGQAAAELTASEWKARSERLGEELASERASKRALAKTLADSRAGGSSLRQSSKAMAKLLRKRSEALLPKAARPLLKGLGKVDPADYAVIEASGAFDAGFYLARYPDIAAAGLDPLQHYLEAGASEGRDPSATFNTTWYLQRHPDVASSGQNPLLHYALYGRHEGRATAPIASLPEDRNAKAAFVIAASGLFDPEFYLSKNPDVAAAGLDPLKHYVETGAREGRDPNPFFQSAWYLAEYGDVATGGANPLAHYIEFGAPEGRAPGPDFDPRWYREANPDVAATGLEALAHYLSIGRGEGRQARPFLATAPPTYFEVAASTRYRNVEEIAVGSTHPRTRPQPQSVTVIVAVYRGLAETRRCIESVLASRERNECFGELIVIDDKSPEPEVSAYVAERASSGGYRLLVNEKNLGFVGSVNRGMAAAGARDVVLLNSDTEVSGDWLDRLASHAAAAEIGTVTPLSNNATICSYPFLGGAPGLPFDKSLEELDRACARANAGRSVDLPTGNGFCLFIKRHCLDEVGLFDAEAFGKGYGEETDFCRRALKRGWRNVLAGDVFVYHRGEVSFAASAKANQALGIAAMDRKHPDYRSAVSAWIQRDPALPLRVAVDAQLARVGESPIVLHLLHGFGGGTEKQVAARIRDERSEASPLVLMVGRRGAMLHARLLSPLGEAFREVSFAARSLTEVAPLLRALGVAVIQVHHALDVGEEIADFLALLDVPYEVTVHDYALLCPRLHLVRRGEYCGEPDERGCASCLSEAPEGRARDIIWWRQRGTALLEDARQVICPSQDAAARVRRYVPRARVTVVPHEPALYRRPSPAQVPSLAPNEPLRIVAMGTMVEHKGGRFLLDCIERSAAIGAPVRWTVLGSFPHDLAARSRELSSWLEVTGAYAPEEALELLARHDPHVVFFPQHCPETYSFTLSEAFMSKRAVLAPKLGAFSERVAGTPMSWLYDVGASPAQIVEHLHGVREQLVGGEPSSS